ncbi:unnamed protein product [Discosporangium mesarthrocarpum]
MFAAGVVCLKLCSLVWHKKESESDEQCCNVCSSVIIERDLGVYRGHFIFAELCSSVVYRHGTIGSAVSVNIPIPVSYREVSDVAICTFFITVYIYVLIAFFALIWPSTRPPLYSVRFFSTNIEC